MNETFFLILASNLAAVLLIYALGGMILEKVKTSKISNIIMILGLIVAWIISAIITLLLNDISNIASASIGSVIALVGVTLFSRRERENS